jgi:multicomponent Na+:H+ antiporter subunit D
MDVFDLRPLLAPLISCGCAALVVVAGKNVCWRRFWSLSAALLKLAVVLSMLPGTLAGAVYYTPLITFSPGVSLAFRADAYGMFFALVTSTLWVFTTVYAIGYLRRGDQHARFFGFFALCVATTVGIAFAENLLTLLLFFELLTVATYPLVVHAETPQALRAGRIYLAYTAVGGAFVLIGSLHTLASAGTLSLAHPGILDLDVGRPALAGIFTTLILGFGVKTAIMPLHGWLPIAMVAPTPVSALLHAVAVVKAGAFGINRVIYNVFGADLLGTLGFTSYLGALAALTIVAASVMALRQDLLKRRLAYSTISQLAYVVLAASLLTPLAALAAVVHVANQAFAKITMFFVAGAVREATGATRVSQLAGIGKQMPYTLAAFTIAAASFVGLPLFAGFKTKWYLSLGALQADAWWFLLVTLSSSLLNAAYWFPIIQRAYFERPAARPERSDGGRRAPGHVALSGAGSGAAGAPGRSREAPPALLVPTLICAAYVLLLGTTAEVPGMPTSIALVAVFETFGLAGVAR